MRMHTCLFSLSLLALSTAASAQQIGEVCETPFETTPDNAYRCLPSFDDQGRPEWEPTRPHLVNGQRGDLLITAGCEGTIPTLLRSMGQHYSHAGVLLDRYEVRHSAGSEAWLLEHPNTSLELLTGQTPLDGFQGDALRHMWPGTLDQNLSEALFGGWVFEPTAGKSFYIDAFDPQVARCNVDEPKFPPLLIKAVLSDLEDVEETTPPTTPPSTPPPAPSWDDDAVRALHEAVADAVSSIDGHYRLGVYTNTDLGRSPSSVAWSSATEATTGAQLLWKGARASGVHLEGALEAEDCEDATAPCTAGTSQADPLHDGLYDYDEAHRSDAADMLEIVFQEKVRDGLRKLAPDVAEWLAWLEEPMQQVANQAISCLVFDWCDVDQHPTNLDGETISCPDSDPRYSTCWRQPGEGRTVNPDDLLRWDGPDKDPLSAYGAVEILQPQLEQWRRVYRWERVDGRGEVTGTVTHDGPINGAEVRVDGQTSSTTALGLFQILGPRPGTHTLEACKPTFGPEGEIVSALSMSQDIEVVAGEVVDVGEIALTSTSGCPFEMLPNPERYRRVTLSGTLKVRDDEWWWESDVVKDFELSEVMLPTSPGMELLLCTGSPSECPDSETISFEACVGDEVRAEVDVTVRLTGQTRVIADAAVRLFEGASGNCETTEDMDGVKAVQAIQLVESDPLEIPITVKNGDWEEDDQIDLALTVTNEMWEDPFDL